MNIHDDVFTVGMLTRRIKQTLESSVPPFWLRGELSGVLFHRSGHLYLTLKDADAQISGVMWRSKVARLDFRPQDGQEVLVFGRLVVYERGGRYQVDIDVIQPAGQGALALEFEKLKNRLAAEGLFDPDRKRPIPRYPRKIGVVTSPTGAAVRDILVTLKRRGFGLEVLLVPVRVQGDTAAAEIATGIEMLAAMNDPPDVLIVGRGGGSIEDLWAFNEERTVRAIAACPIPVIAGVGHETDITLADLVADLRAPTPTGAAERAVPDRLELLDRVTQQGRRSARAMSGRLEGVRLRLEAAGGGYGLRRLPDRLVQHEQRLDELDSRGRRALRDLMARKADKLAAVEQRLHALSPLSVVQRGYAVVRKKGAVVRGAEDVQPGDDVQITLAGGEADASIQEVRREHG